MTEITLEFLFQKLNRIEQHLINLILPIQDLNSVFTDGEQTKQLMNMLSRPIQIDDRAFGTLLKEWKEMSYKVLNDLEKVDIAKTLDEIRYIGIRLNDMEKTLKSWQEKGIKKEIKLELSCDGYELVKKPANYDEVDETAEKGKSDDDYIREVLVTLSDRYQKCIIHRLGLLGENKKTFAAIGKIFGVTGGRIGTIYEKAIRKLRAKTMKNKMKKIKNHDLVEAVYGKSMHI